MYSTPKAQYVHKMSLTFIFFMFFYVPFVLASEFEIRCEGLLIEMSELEVLL